MNGEIGIGKSEDFAEWARYYDPNEVFRDLNARFK